MKTVTINENYPVLKDAKLSKMDSKNQFVVMKALRFLKPIVDNYTEAVKGLEEKVTSCSKEEIEAHREKARKHQEAIQNNSADGLLSGKEIFEVNTFFKKVDEEMQGLKKELDNEEVELTYDKLSDDDFLKVIESNPELTASQINMLYDLLV